MQAEVTPRSHHRKALRLHEAEPSASLIADREKPELRRCDALRPRYALAHCPCQSLNWGGNMDADSLLPGQGPSEEPSKNDEQIEIDLFACLQGFLGKVEAFL